MKKYMIFSFEKQDYLTENDKPLIFDYRSQALRYLQENFTSPNTKSKKIYVAPYQVHKLLKVA